MLLSCKETKDAHKKCSRLIFVYTHGSRGINFLDGHGIHLNVSCFTAEVFYFDFCFFQGKFLRYEIEFERHHKYTKCEGCGNHTKPELPTIKFQMGLEPANQIKAEKAMGLTRKFQWSSISRIWSRSLEIGLESNSWVLVPAKDVINMNSTVEDEAMSARGNCYPSCFQGDLPEITLHSIMGFGSRNVKKMKILKLTDGKMATPCDNCKRHWFRLSKSF